jgi:hypothetical protein
MTGGKSMKDLIDRQAAIDAVLRAEALVRAYGYRYAADAVRELPAVQPQSEIIRCKDCKHSRFFDPCLYCYEFGGEIIVPENGFCFMAERRTDE